MLPPLDAMMLFQYVMGADAAVRAGIGCHFLTARLRAMFPSLGMCREAGEALRESVQELAERE